MKQTSSLTRKLAKAQDRLYVDFPVTPKPNQAVVYRLYTEDLGNLTELASRYFSGFTLLFGNGVWQGVGESSVVIEVIGTTADLEQIAYLAEDIRRENNQSSVLVTWANVSLLNVTADV
jgi:hypothetical protein